MDELLEIIDGLTGVAVSIAAQAAGAELDARTFDRLAHLNTADRAVLKMLGPYALRSLPAFFAALERFGGYLFAGVLVMTWKRKFDEVGALAREQRAAKREDLARQPEFSTVSSSTNGHPSSAP